METITPDQIQQAETDNPPAGGRPGIRNRAAWWRFTRHLTEMVIAMIVGMAALGIAVVWLGRPPGYDNLSGHYAWMGVAMSIPMVAWMRRMGHAWSDGVEMTAAMLVPMFALVLPVQLGMVGPEPSLHSLMAPTHAAMIAGMAALMVYRWDRYAGGAHCQD